MKATLRIGSRPSKLAIIQAGIMRDAIAAAIPGLEIEIVPISTSGDKMATPHSRELAARAFSSGNSSRRWWTTASTSRSIR